MHVKSFHSLTTKSSLLEVEAIHHIFVLCGSPASALFTALFKQKERRDIFVLDTHQHERVIIPSVLIRHSLSIYKYLPKSTMQQPSSGLCVTPRDSFLTDPFFLAARQTLERCLHEIYQKHKDLAPSQLSASPVIVNGPVALLSCGCPRDPIVSRLGSWAPAILIPCVFCQQCCTSQVHAPMTMTLQQVQLVAEQQAAQLAQQQAAQFAQQQAAQFAQKQAEQLAQQQAENLMRQLALNHAQQLVPQLSNPGEISIPPAQLTLFNNNFELLLDVHGFLPNELHVSVKDEFVEVRAERLETQQAFSAQSTGQSSQGFLRRYKLPHSVNGELVQCNISSDAILHISAPWKV